ncbi:MAG: TIGR01777 family oxidoreductase [Thiolinea sp.]
MERQHYLITGGSGFIGLALIPTLLKQGHQISLLSRKPEKTLQQFGAPPDLHTFSDFAQLDRTLAFDGVINLAGQGIADQRWSAAVKKQLTDSRILTTRALVNWLAQAEQQPKILVSGSAIGYYGLRGDERLDEQAQGDDSFASTLCQQWEQEAQAAEALGIRTCYLRTGIVLGKGGGALARMLPPFRFGLGGPIGSGEQWMSWIHRDDLVNLILLALERDDLNGPLNGTAPEPVTSREFARTLGHTLNRPAILPMPAFAVKLLFGQMGEELLLSGQRVIPAKAQDLGYTFRYPQLQEALRAIV